jgi:hypothetical protein
VLLSYTETPQKVRSIGTTAFTDKPVSMKYRGVFDLHSQKAGAFAFASPLGPVAFGNVYMTSDFAMQSSVPRLSKLVLACILSTEVRDILEQKLAQKVRTIRTTAFTDKPVSM